MQLEHILLIIAGGIILVLLIALIVVYSKYKKLADRQKKCDNTEMIDGIRYTRNDAKFHESGEVAVSYRVGDIVLMRGETYTAKKGGKVAPGKYTVLSCDGMAESFNLRLGGLVRDYEHSDDIVLAEGDEICAVSRSVILR